MKTRQIINVWALLMMGSSFLAASCRKEQPSADEPIVPSASERNAANPVIETGMTLARINAVIAGASAGQTVLVQPGTYAITGKIAMKAGVSLVKQTSVNPVFDASDLKSKLTLNYSSELNNCLFSGLTFWNIRVVVTNASKAAFKHCIFDYGKRTPNTNKTNNLKDDYLELVNTDSSLVFNCVFSCRSTDPGRGVWTKNTTNARIQKNTFGNGGSTGYFVCAINDNSLRNSVIEDNTIARNSALNTIDSLTDHGMYAHSFNGLTISGNTFASGWPTNASGGNIKARNGQHLTISNNTLNDSGILLYEYSNTPAFPYLKHVMVSNNAIHISSPANDMYHGIGYYRNNTTDSEYSINITGNRLPNGTIYALSTNIAPANFNAAGGGVYNNDTATGYLLLRSGIANSDNY